MHVPIEHHRRIVSSLLGALILILILLIMAARQAGFFHPPEPSEPAQYLQKEEVVVITPENPETEEAPVILPIEKTLFEYIEVIDSCRSNFEGECLNVRSGPGIDYPVVTKLRNGVVLKVGGEVERDGEVWYKIVFDEWIRYPERIKDDWYVNANFVRILFDEGNRDWTDRIGTTTKKIVVDRSEQIIYAYDGLELIMQEPISTGIELTPTPRGIFTIFKKTPSRYMQGPIPGITEKYYDLPGVPWNLYFTHQGAVIHGAYWHENFGRRSSSGCVNLPPDKAYQLYTWADVGTRVIVQD